MDNQWVVVILAFILCVFFVSLLKGAEKVQRDQRKKLIEDEKKKISDRFKWM